MLSDFIIGNYFFKQVREECAPLELSEGALKEVMTRLNAALTQGLGKDTNAKSVVKCFPTYVRDLPDGTGEIFFLYKTEYTYVNKSIFLNFTEKGKFLAL